MERITRARAIKYFSMTFFGRDGFYGGSVGTTKDQAIKMVRECESNGCPLYNFRTGVETTPVQSKNFSLERKDSMQKRAKNLRKRKWT